MSEIQSLIRFVAKSGVSEVELETKEFKITIKSPDKNKKGGEGETTIIQQVPMMAAPQVAAAPAPAPAPAPAAAPAPAPAEAKAAEEPAAKGEEITSPMIGTFYRSAGPEKPAFVNVGDTIKAGDVICIIEAMKLFNEIEAEVSGKIVKVLVDDATPVEYGTPLFLVEPA